MYKSFLQALLSVASTDEVEELCPKWLTGDQLEFECQRLSRKLQLDRIPLDVLPKPPAGRI